MNSDISIFEAIVKSPLELKKKDIKGYTFVIINQMPEDVT